MLIIALSKVRIPMKSVFGEMLFLMVSANTELAWFERYALGRTTYVPERAPGDEIAPPK